MDKFFFNKNPCKYKHKNCNLNLKDNLNDFTLANLCLNEVAIILDYKQSIPFLQKKRLLELGFVRQNRVKLINKSVLGEVLLFEINGFMLSVRVDISKHILCERIYDK